MTERERGLWRSTRPRPAEERFWEKVEKTDGCWLWRGSINALGYGNFCPTRARTVKAHRFAYEALIGPIPEGCDLDHVRARGCTNRHCVNPAHLEPVSHRENIRRGDSPSSRNGRKTHCVNGHEFTPENIYYRPDNGARQCRECARLREATRVRRPMADRAYRQRTLVMILSPLG